jgi:hypothetical protein
MYNFDGITSTCGVGKSGEVILNYIKSYLVMPNECSNRLLITGDAKEIKRFLWNNMVDGRLKLRFPTPFDQIMTDADFTTLHQRAGGVSIDFLTDWTPPLNWLQHISSEYESLSFIMTYYELGMEYYGVAEAKNGHLENRQFLITDGDIRGHSDDESSDYDRVGVEYAGGKFADILSITGMKYEAWY